MLFDLDSLEIQDYPCSKCNESTIMDIDSIKYHLGILDIEFTCTNCKQSYISCFSTGFTTKRK
jgi:hypothetical protein